MTNDEKIAKIKKEIIISNSMNVTYSLYGKYGKLLEEYNNVACFRHLNHNNNWYKLKLKLKSTKKNIDYIEFWLKLIMRIETKITIKDNYLIIPNLGIDKTMFILTAIRYLWEGSNNYDDIVIMTKKIIDLHPNIDPLKAILLANSCTTHCCGWGHSLVNCVVNQLKGIWHYRRYKGNTVFSFTNSSYGNQDLLKQFRKAKLNDYDVLPVLKHFGYE
mgnify:CR=1 FL=1